MTRWRPRIAYTTTPVAPVENAPGTTTAAERAAPMDATNLTRRARLQRIRLLRNNIIDVSIVIDDLDAELAPRLAARAQWTALLREAQRELARLIGRAA